jgi:hypothetical protein
MARDFSDRWGVLVKPVGPGDLYLMGTARHHDLIAIRRSRDAGTTWTMPDDAVSGARNNHDANFLTFHRVTDFRGRTMADSVVDPASLGW